MVDNEEPDVLSAQTPSCRAPIASLDCMDEVSETAGSMRVGLSRCLSKQTSINISPGIRYRNLGKSGLRVSNLGLGTWISFGALIPNEVADEILTVAYDNGVNVFDTAEIYTGGSSCVHKGRMSSYKAEVLLGKMLKRKCWRRSSYVVTTKLYWGNRADMERGLSRKCIIEGVKGALERIQLEYVDVIFANKADPLCPMEEVVRAFTFCINQGWIMYWGTSRWSPMEIMEAYTVARQFNLIPPTCEQAEYHMFCREKTETQLPELYHKIGVGAMCWSPMSLNLGNNKFDDTMALVTRSSFKGCMVSKEKRNGKVNEVARLAEKLGCTLSQLMTAWCLRNEHVHCTLVGATSVDEMLEQIQALQLMPRLSTNVINELERILDNKPIRLPVRR